MKKSLHIRYKLENVNENDHKGGENWKKSRLSTVKHEMTAVKRVIQQNFLQKWMELKKNMGILQF